MTEGTRISMEESLAVAKTSIDFRIATEILGWTITDERFVSLGHITLNAKWYMRFGSPLVRSYPNGELWAPSNHIECAMGIVEHFVRAERGPTLYTPFSKTDEGLDNGPMYACHIPGITVRTGEAAWDNEEQHNGYARATTMCLAICEAALDTLNI